MRLSAASVARQRVCVAGAVATSAPTAMRRAPAPAASAATTRRHDDADGALDSEPAGPGWRRDGSRATKAAGPSRRLPRGAYPALAAPGTHLRGMGPTLTPGSLSSRESDVHRAGRRGRVVRGARGHPERDPAPRPYFVVGVSDVRRRLMPVFASAPVVVVAARSRRRAFAAFAPNFWQPREFFSCCAETGAAVLKRGRPPLHAPVDGRGGVESAGVVHHGPVDPARGTRTPSLGVPSECWLRGLHGPRASWTTSCGAWTALPLGAMSRATSLPPPCSDV